MFQRIGRRLAILNMIVVIGIILLAGGVTYVALSRSLTNEVDTALRERIDVAAGDPANAQGNQDAASRGEDSERGNEEEDDDDEDERDHEIIESGDTIILFLGPDGEIVVNPRGLTLLEIPVAEGVNRALTGDSNTLTVRIGGETTRVMTVPLTDDGQIVGAIQGLRSLSEHEGQLAIVRTMTIVGVGLGMLIAAPAGYYLSRRAMVPINVAFERQRAFVADASHELRTPLTVIRANAEYALMEPEQPVAEVAGSLNQILREVDHTDRLVDDLLLLARLEAGQLRLERRAMQVVDVVREACDSMRPAFEACQITLELPEPAPARVLADPDRLQQALRIVLDNAAKYSEPGGTVAVAIASRRDRIVIAVSDTGPGIPPEHLPHVFERFYRVDASRSRGQGGIGLGLAIARGIVEAHSGTLTLESRVGVGTTATMTLPVDVGHSTVETKLPDNRSDPV
jgi:signal transduction histidine kinase